jgi:uncharacterized membrane protein YgaE (UPF0421/DUF939 family)
MAGLLLGHERPVVAAIAAVISLGAVADRTGRKAAEWMFGIALGLATADLLMFLVGSGTLQVGLVVALAMAAAVFFGGGPAFVTEAGVSALLVVALDPSTVGPTPDRFLDATVGCAVAFAIHALLPNDPEPMVENAAEPVLGGLSAVLHDIAWAVEKGDLEAAEGALERARALDGKVVGLKDALGIGYDTARVSPHRRRSLGRLALYAVAADQLDLAVRNTRVLARAAVDAAKEARPAPASLVRAVHDLALAVDDLDRYLKKASRAEPAEEDLAGSHAREAAREALDALEERNDLATSVLVGQVRSTAEDLLRAAPAPSGRA